MTWTKPTDRHVVTRTVLRSTPWAVVFRERRGRRSRVRTSTPQAWRAWVRGASLT